MNRRHFICALPMLPLTVKGLLTEPTTSLLDRPFLVDPSDYMTPLFGSQGPPPSAVAEHVFDRRRSIYVPEFINSEYFDGG